ncbi:MAG: tetratricopeptide repeat protein [Pseudomonadota bacterium]
MDDGTGFLRRRDVDIALQPQVLSVLRYLLENRDRIVSKDELVEALWDGRIVSDAALNTRLRDVRRALGDDGKEQRFVRTFPKRGVQFVAPVTESEGHDAVAPSLDPDATPGRNVPIASRRLVPRRAAFAVAGLLLLGAGAIGVYRLPHSRVLDMTLSLPAQPSIAVLRFTTDEPAEHRHIADGLAEDLIADLAQFDELFVISRNTAFTFNPETIDPRQVRQELGVEFVARGSVRRTDQSLRVIAELVDTATGEAVWTERFDRPVSDVFLIQDEISDAISGRILPEMVKARVVSTRRTPTDDLSAWDLLIQAKAQQAVFSKDGQERAISLARAALDRDPDLWAALSLIAQAKGNLFFWSDGDKRLRDDAISAARQALEMTPDDPMAYAALGYVYRFTGEESRAVRNLERAVALNPNSAIIRLQLAHTLDWFRKQERALPEIERAIRLSPRDPLLQNMLFYKAHILFHLQRYEESLEAAELMGAVVSSGPWEIFYHFMRAAALAELGREAEARAAIEAAQSLKPGLTLTTMKARFDRSKNHPKNRALWLASLKKAGLPD